MSSEATFGEASLEAPAGAPFTAPLRVRWAHGHVPSTARRREVSRRLLHTLLGPEIEVRQRCPRCGGDDHGPLETTRSAALAGISYAGDRVVVAAAGPADGIEAFGIDAEPDTHAPHDAVGLDAVLRPGATLREWTRIEAVLKADRRGLNIDPAQVDVRALRTDGSWQARLPAASPVFFGWDLRDPAFGGLVVSASVRAGSPEAAAAPARRARR